MQIPYLVPATIQTGVSVFVALSSKSHTLTWRLVCTLSKAICNLLHFKGIIRKCSQRFCFPALPLLRTSWGFLIITKKTKSLPCRLQLKCCGCNMQLLGVAMGNFLLTLEARDQWLVLLIPYLLLHSLPEAGSKTASPGFAVRQRLKWVTGNVRPLFAIVFILLWYCFHPVRTKNFYRSQPFNSLQGGLG